MFIITGINALIKLALELAIRDEEERKAAKAAAQAALAGVAGAVGDVGAAVSTGVQAGSEAAKLATKDAGVLEVIDSVTSAVGGGAEGFLDGLETGLLHLGLRSGAAGVGMGIGHAADGETGRRLGLNLALGLAGNWREGLAERALLLAGRSSGAAAAIGGARLATAHLPAEERERAALMFADLGLQLGQGMQRLAQGGWASATANLKDEARTARAELWEGVDDVVGVGVQLAASGVVAVARHRSPGFSYLDAAEMARGGMEALSAAGAAAGVPTSFSKFAGTPAESQPWRARIGEGARASGSIAQLIVREQIRIERDRAARKASSGEDPDGKELGRVKEFERKALASASGGQALHQILGGKLYKTV